MRYVVGVGSSDAHAHERVQDAVARIDRHPLLSVVARSRAYENPAWGGATAARFVNAAVVVDTSLSASALLRALHAVEAECGRVRSGNGGGGGGTGSRTLDLDVLWHIDAATATMAATATTTTATTMATTTATATATTATIGAPIVPHPRLLHRAFAVVPCVEAMRAVVPPIPIPYALVDAARVHATAPLAPLRSVAAPT